MSKHSKIVVEHYPVRRLPEELQSGLDRDQLAKVTIEVSGEEETNSLKSYVGSARGVYRTPDDALDAIREQRDGWK
jgi:hypothetical protein